MPSAEGVEGVESGEGYPLPLLGSGLGRRLCPLPRNFFFDFLSGSGAFWALVRLDALAKASSVIATATWLGGWLAGCPSHNAVLYQNG